MKAGVCREHRAVPGSERGCGSPPRARCSARPRRCPARAGVGPGGAAGHTSPRPAALRDCEPAQSHRSPSAGRQSASGLATQLSAGLFLLVQRSLSHLEDTETSPHHHCQGSSRHQSVFQWLLFLFLKQHFLPCLRGTSLPNPITQATPSAEQRVNTSGAPFLNTDLPPRRSATSAGWQGGKPNPCSLCCGGWKRPCSISSST